MPGLGPYLCDGFIKSGMGLMCDFTRRIEKVYTTVFLSDKVLARVLEGRQTHALILSHHPTNWGIKGHGGNYAAAEEYIRALKDRSISIYVLHHPLDNYGDYSTCKTLAHELGIAVETPAFACCGALCGVVGQQIAKPSAN